MKFRDKVVDGFFTVSMVDETCGELLTEEIEHRLESLNADMVDVQYSTHWWLGKDGIEHLVHDVLVMYAVKRRD